MKRVIPDELMTDLLSVKVRDALDQCRLNPSARKLYGRMTNIRNGSKLTWLEGVVDVVDALDLVTLDGLVKLRNLMLQFGEDAVMDAIRDRSKV